MRHGDKINNLSRTASHRKALLSGLACQLFQHKRIVTTLAKAKALRPYVEPLITKSKENTTHQRRIVFSRLNDKEAIKELFDVISPKIGTRPGGYTRIIKLGKRVGDNAELAMIELVDYNEIYTGGTTGEESTAHKTRRGRSRRGGAKRETTPKVEEKAVKEEAHEEKKAVAPATEEKPKEKEEKVEKEDLSKVEGIGPKAAGVLELAGITSFALLAGKKAEEIKEILDKSEGHFASMDPTTWPEQAQLAADGKWDELKELQDKLHGGKEDK